MPSKAKTMNLPKGGEYARVPERIKLFREDNPNGLIETKPEFLPDGGVMFTARILKDKARPESAEATGHALGSMNENKAFEKLESIAIGRGLAVLGYLASGEIASADEMEDFYKYRDEKVNEVIGRIKNTETLDELKSYFLGLGSMMAEEAVIKAKDEMKIKLGKQDENKKVQY